MKQTALKSTLLLAPGAPLEPGKLYLHLFHGRNDPAQEMEDWGFDGPTFGPLSWYVHTYCSTFRICSEDGNTELWLEPHDDLIAWDGSYYGDMELFIAGQGETA